MAGHGCIFGRASSTVPVRIYTLYLVLATRENSTHCECDPHNYERGQASVGACAPDVFVKLTGYHNQFFFFFFSRDQLTKQKKKMSQITHLAAVFDCRTIIVGYYITIIIQLACTCAYNIDDLFHTGRIDPPGMEKVVYIVCAYTGYIRGY